MEEVKKDLILICKEKINLFYNYQRLNINESKERIRKLQNFLICFPLISKIEIARK